MSHAKAKLTPLGRHLLVERVLEQGWTPAEAARSMGVSRATAYKWLGRYRQEGEAGLHDRSSRPHRLTRAHGEEQVAHVLARRQATRWGPHLLAVELGLARSTVYGILRRHGLSRLDRMDPVTREIIRYQRERPGELVHLDVKKLARIPQGGGHRLLGRSSTTKHRGAGYEFLHVAVDDCSRVGYVERLSDERGETAAGFLTRAAAFFAERGVQVESVLTDRAFCYTQSRAFWDACHAIGARHLTTRPYRPQTNGKAERFIRTLINEWAYDRLYLSNEERFLVLSDWLTHYNHSRPHTALGGSSPMPFLVNKVCGNYN